MAASIKRVLWGLLLICNFSGKIMASEFTCDFSPLLTPPPKGFPAELKPLLPKEEGVKLYMEAIKDTPPSNILPFKLGPISEDFKFPDGFPKLAPLSKIQEAYPALIKFKRSAQNIGPLVTDIINKFTSPEQVIYAALAADFLNRLAYHISLKKPELDLPPLKWYQLEHSIKQKKEAEEKAFRRTVARALNFLYRSACLGSGCSLSFFSSLFTSEKESVPPQIERASLYWSPLLDPPLLIRFKQLQKAPYEKRTSLSRYSTEPAEGAFSSQEYPSDSSEDETVQKILEDAAPLESSVESLRKRSQNTDNSN